MLRRLLTFTLVLLLLSPPAASAAGSWRWPVRGQVITAYRNGDDPYAAGQHRGIDIAGAVGDPVEAAVGGEVRYAGALGSSGIVVSVRTSDGAYDTSYLHLSSVAVARGEHVAAGDRLGAVGTTGERSATAPHLHFGVREAGQRQAYLDPLRFLGPLGSGGDAPAAVPVPHAAPAPVAVPRPAGAVSQAAPTPARGGKRASERHRVWRPFRTPAVVPAARAHREGARSGLRHAPAGSSAPVRARSSAPVRSLAPERSTGAAHATARHPALTRRHATAAAAEARHARYPDTGPATSLHAAEHPARAASTPSQPRSADRATDGGGGPDLGLVLACLSLAAAAVGLGMRGCGRSSSRRRGAYRVNRALSRLVHHS